MSAQRRKNRNVPIVGSVSTGSLLIITLWLVTILSVLAVAIARYLSIEVRLTKYHLAQAQAKALARSGIYLAMERLHEDVEGGGEGYDWMWDDWAYFPGSHPEDPTRWVVELPAEEEDELTSNRTVEIQVVDEERKLPLNKVRDDPGDLWFIALRELLGSPGRARRIVDYIDDNTDPFGPEGLESDEAADPPYLAKNGAVVAHEELLDIPNMADAFSTLRKHTSIAELNGKLNINTVDPAVLVALGFRAATAQAFEACREGGLIFDSEATILTTAESCAGPAGLSAAEQTLLANEFGVTSQTFTVVSKGRLERPAIEVRVEALIQRSADGGEAPRILAWREE